jgi:serine/threonine-protein kinase
MTLEPNVPLALGELARAKAFLGRWDEIPELTDRNAVVEGPQALWFMRARFALWQRDRVTAARYADQMKDAPRVLAVARWIIEQILHAAPPTDAIDLSFFVAKDDASARRRSFVYQIETEVRAFHNQLDGALTSIEKAVDEGLFDLAWLERCPLLTPLHGHARYQASRAVVEGRVRAVMLDLG